MYSVHGEANAHGNICDVLRTASGAHEQGQPLEIQTARDGVDCLKMCAAASTDGGLQDDNQPFHWLRELLDENVPGIVVDLMRNNKIGTTAVDRRGKQIFVGLQESSFDFTNVDRGILYVILTGLHRRGSTSVDEGGFEGQGQYVLVERRLKLVS